MIARNKRTMWIALAAAPALLLVGCTSGGGGGASADPNAGGDGANTPVTLKLATSYSADQPQQKCGADVIAEEVKNKNVGLTIDIFGDSQLGGDADRVSAIASGDIDMDLQGASALGAIYEPISVLDAAYAFNDPAHLKTFMASEQSKVLTDGFQQASGISALGAWSTGSRQFTANVAIRTPEDLAPLRMRFPGTPQYLANAKALGAQATEVAFEELYLALQQGTVDGQENPITNIKALNLQEVQKFLSLSAHQLSTNLVIINSAKWDTLSEDQQKALSEAVDTAVDKVTQCVADDEKATLDEWKKEGKWTIVDDVDRDAFQKKAVDYFNANYTGDSLAVFKAIRETAPN